MAAVMKKTEQRMTVRKIAALAGVSPTAVSLVLNGKKGVGADTRDRIRKILTEHDYTPAPRAKKSAYRLIRLIKYRIHGMAVEENQGFTASIIDHIELECRRYHYDLVISGCTNETAEEVFRLTAHEPLAGLILLATEFDAANFDMLRAVRAPLVVLDHSMAGQDVDSVVMANANISAAAVRYLYDLGHREIGYFLTSVRVSNFTERYRGYLDKLAELGLTPPAPVLLTPTLNGAYREMKRLLADRAYAPRGAVLAGNDSIAIGAARALREAGYRIPGDISVIGVDDIPFSSMTLPPLTTMRISRSAMGTLTVNLLRDRIRHPDWPSMKMQINAQLVERGSVAPAE
jgi:LacI family transcriptional regulator